MESIDFQSTDNGASESRRKVFIFWGWRTLRAPHNGQFYKNLV